MPLVATGNIDIAKTPPAGEPPKEVIITAGDIGATVYRACSVGTAACRLDGVDVKQVDPRSGMSKVDVSCSAGACGLKGLQLQESLDRLRDRKVAS